MKQITRYLASFLAALCATSCLFSCAPAERASADSSSRRADRLLSSDGVVYGTAEDALAYGIDMSGFRDSGYVIRKENGNAAVFGKTEAALDRAAHKYAKSFADESDVNFVVGEGYPVKSLTVCGVPIAEYTVTLSISESGYQFRECARFAVSELITYINQATGVTLTEGQSEHEIRLIQTESDSEYGNDGFRIVAADGGITVYGGYKRGLMYGVYELLEDYVGWRFLGDMEGMTYCRESDGIDLDGIDYTFAPAFTERGIRDDYFAYAPGMCTGVSAYPYTVKRKLNGAVGSSTNYAKYGWPEGRQSTIHTFATQLADVTDCTDCQPCLTDPVNVECCAEYVTDQITALKEIYGDSIPLPPTSIGPNDNRNYCICKNCKKLYHAGGDTQAATLIPFINDVISIVEETHPDATYTTIAYQEGVKPPTNCVPSDKLNILFCVIEKCVKHSLYDADCECDKDGKYLINNPTFAKYLSGWCELTDHLGVWDYYANYENSLVPLALYDTLRNDIRYFAEAGVTIHTGEAYNTGFSFDHLYSYLMARLLWDPYLSEDEYDAIRDEWMAAYYGEGWQYILEYFELLQLSGKNTNCFCGIGSWTEEQADFSLYDGKYEEILDRFAEAKRLADSTEQEKRIDDLEIHVHYLHLCSVYSDEYLHGTDEERAAYEALYTDFFNTVKAVGYTHNLFAHEIATEIDLSTNPSLQWGNFSAEFLSPNRFVYE